MAEASNYNRPDDEDEEEEDIDETVCQTHLVHSVLH